MEEKQTLSNIVFQVAEITNEIVESGGEISPEMEAKLMDIDLTLAKKVDAYSNVIERLKMETEFWNKKSKEMKAIADSHERIREKLKTRIKDAMRAMHKNEIFGQGVKFRLVKSQPKLLIRDEKAIPPEFQVVSWELDREKIKKQLLQDLKVPGAELEDSFSLRAFARKD